MRHKKREFTNLGYILELDLFYCEVYSKENSLPHQIGYHADLRWIHTIVFSPLILKWVNEFYLRNPQRQKKAGDSSPGCRAQAEPKTAMAAHCCLPHTCQSCEKLVQLLSLSQTCWGGFLFPRSTAACLDCQQHAIFSSPSSPAALPSLLRHLEVGLQLS